MIEEFTLLFAIWFWNGEICCIFFKRMTILIHLTWIYHIIIVMQSLCRLPVFTVQYILS